MVPEVKLFTVQDLHDWLYDANPSEGLSERIIAPQRAWAIIHNPYVQKIDTVLVGVFVDGEPVAYSAAFPEKTDAFGDERIWWLSTLYCEKDYLGRGLGLVAIGSFIELYGEDYCFDADGAPETIGIFSYFGFQTKYYKQYLLHQKHYSNTIKGALLSCYNGKKKEKKYKTFKTRISELEYSIKYTSFISGNAYCFIKNKSNEFIWLRSQETLNWILRFPFMQPGTIQKRVAPDLLFTSNISTYLLYAVEVYVKEAIVGCYIVRDSSWNFAIPYLYLDENYKNEVFSSIAENFFESSNKDFATMSKELASFLLNYGLFDVIEEDEKSFSFPKSFEDRCKMMQLGDGDMFVF